MKTMIEREKSIDELLDGLDLIPQLSRNIETDLTKLSENLVAKISEEANTNLNNGRVLVRKSGTEPLLRITVESKDKVEAQKIIESVKTQINQA